MLPYKFSPSFSNSILKAQFSILIFTRRRKSQISTKYSKTRIHEIICLQYPVNLLGKDMNRLFVKYFKPIKKKMQMTFTSFDIK